MLLLVLDRQLKTAMHGSAVDKAATVARLRLELAETELLLREHASLDLEMRREVKRIQDEAIELYNREVSEGVDLSASHAWRSRNAIYMRHVDDKAAMEWPKVPQESSAFLERFKTCNAGLYDMIHRTMTSILTETGLHGKKDAYGVLEEIVVEALLHANGERFGVFVFDCGPLNHGSVIAACLPQLLCDLGVFDVCRVYFYQQYHGKGDADKSFGHQETAFRRAWAFRNCAT